MPHSFPVTVNTTKLSIKPPQMIYNELETINTRHLVPTPPLSSSPVVELAPIVDFSCVERPPSPKSPKTRDLINESKKESRPTPLEPLPQFNEEKNLFPMSLFEPMEPTHSCIIPSSIQIPIPLRSLPPQSPRYSFQNTSSMSPTMAAASASAVNHTKNVSFSDCHPKENKYKNSNRAHVDQSMFLTKNAHIKRPRNAWIHFRCHYGQALKIQDPTLRAEEISKRASQRWSKLSENEKKPWHSLAEQEKLAHREAFPEYRYCPRRATPSPTLKRSMKDTPLDMHDDCTQKRLKRKTK